MTPRIALVTLAAIAAMTALVAGLAQPEADAGGTVCDSIGPDVIVGELTGPSNYSSVGGIEAFAIGTTSCNIGDEELLWIANSNQHPVIGQNLFQYVNGRFRQIGQAWLKHGFTALQQNACGCGCQPSGTGTRLGVGCSDPYSSGLNGSQGGMGPKFEVNAYNGFFEWPATDFNNTGNSIYKRLQASITDLEQGGAFMVEGQYIAPDDSEAGNQYNNVSWRNATITGGGSSWSMSLNGATEREAPAIANWPELDPNAFLAVADVPGEGRFYLGWTATNLGDGNWEYEFALYNMNSDRSAGGFTVPLPAGSTVSSTDFHDVDYHSGEPWSGTDWAVTVGSSGVSWATEDHAANPDANALRWGTLYNFSLVVDASPVEVTDVEIDLFKPGTPTSITVDLAANGNLLFFEYPNGLPAEVDPAGGTTVRVRVLGLAGAPAPGTGMLHYDDGGGFQSIPMSIVGLNVYDAVFPAVDCANVAYYFSSQVIGGSGQSDPLAAPADFYEAPSGDITVLFEDDFEADQGWTVTNDRELSDGAWDRGVPLGGGDRGDPPTDADGSGQCYVTDRADGDSDVDHGATTLTSPVMDASQGNPILRYHRWYWNSTAGEPETDVFLVDVSDDGGATWLNLETVGPDGPEANGGWYFKQFALADVPGLALNDQFRVRFIASDESPASIIEAGVDGVELLLLDCDGGCAADLTGDGVVGVPDLLAVLAAWGTPDGDITGDGTTDVPDLLAVLAAWGPC